jgi:DNA polymerase III subunit beta
MKFKSERDILAEALSAAGRAVSNRVLGAPSGILLNLQGNQLTVTGTDTDLIVRTSFMVVGSEDGSVVVPARLIGEVVRSLESGAVSVHSVGENLEIELNNARFNLRTFPVSDYPKISPITGAIVEIPAADLATGLAQTLRAAATDDARPLLTGVLLTSENNSLRLIATDSYRLAVRDVPGIPSLNSTKDLLVPARALSELQRATTNLADDGTIGVAVTDSEISFVVGETSIASRLIDGNYPSVLQLIPASFSNQLRIAKDTLLSSLRRAKLMAKDSTSSVRLTLKELTLEIRTQSQDSGDVEDKIQADYSGEEITIAFNPHFLIEGIESVVGDEIVLEVSDSVRPALIHGVDDLKFKYLLMPVRI